jgi:hypothetical protein
MRNYLQNEDAVKKCACDPRLKIHDEINTKINEEVRKLLCQEGWRMPRRSLVQWFRDLLGK